ncbi:MAG: hypothetical protein ACJ786_19900 [Catenulispora sp.]
MRRFRLLAAGLIAAAAVAGAGTSSRPAAAASLIRSGWWNAANNGTVAPPAPPDVPEGGLSIQGSPDKPAAFGAVAYELSGSEAPGQLKLKISGTPTPNAAVKACVIPSGDFPSGPNQPMTAQPTYDCVNVPAIAGTVTADGMITFDLSQLATSSRLALAILPVGASDRIATEAPDGSSLATQPAPTDSSDSSDRSPPSSGSGSDSYSSSYDSGSASSSSSSDNSLAATPSSGASSGTSSAPSLSPTYDSGTSLSLTTPAAPAEAAAPAATAATDTETAAPPAPVRQAAAAARSDWATKAGGLMALALLLAAMAAYIRGFGLMGGRIAD